MKRIKKIVCSMTALALLVCMFGCERKEKEKTVIKQEVDIQKADDESSIADEFKGVYKYQTLDFTNDNINDTKVIGKSSGGYWVSYKISDGNGNIVDYKVKKVGIENGSEICKAKLEQLPKELQENISYLDLDFAITSDGGFVQLLCLENSTNHAGYNFYAVRFDDEGNYVNNQFLYSSQEDEIPFFNIYPIENDSFIIANSLDGKNNYYFVYDGKKTVSKSQKLKNTENSIKKIVALDDKTAIAFYSTAGSEEKFYTFDIESGQTGEEQSLDGRLNAEIKGIDDKYYGFDTSGIYSLDLEGSKKQIIVNYTNSSIDGTKITEVFPLENGDFLAVMSDENFENESLIRLKKADPKSLENIQTITVAVGNDKLLSQIAKYNASQDKYKIVAKDYMGDNGDFENASKQLNLDIASGKAPDIISFDIMAYNIYDFVKKGALIDLYPLIQQDENINLDDYYSGILKAHEYDGKLLGVCNSFAIDTWTCDAQGELANQFKDGWTFDEFIDFYNNIPEGKSFFETGSADRFSCMNWLVYNNLDSFIDFKNSSCSFDTPEFINFLEFMKILPNDYTAVETGQDTTNWTEENYEENRQNRHNLSNEELNDKTYKQTMALRNGDAFVHSTSIGNILNYWYDQNNYFKNGMKFIGFPIIESESNKNSRVAQIYTQNSFGILSSSKYPEQCWDFLKIVMDSDTSRGSSININRNTLEKIILREIQSNSYVDENGNVTVHANTIQFDVDGKEMPPPTWEDFKPFIEYLDTLEAHSEFPTEICNIINEECQSFYNNKQDSKKTAKDIEDRILIYLSEHKD